MDFRKICTNINGPNFQNNNDLKLKIYPTVKEFNPLFKLDWIKKQFFVETESDDIQEMFFDCDKLKNNLNLGYMEIHYLKTAVAMHFDKL